MMNETDNIGNIFDLTQRSSSLYKFTTKLGIEVRNRVGLSNGIAFNENKGKMYWVDSYDMNVKEFDYNQSTGDICESKV